MPIALIALCAFMKNVYGKPKGVLSIDSTGLAVCSLPRAKHHQIFVNEADWEKSSTGGFFGFKLQLAKLQASICELERDEDNGQAKNA